MMDKQQMFSVLQAFRASEECRKCMRYLDEIEEFIENDFSEDEYGVIIEEMRKFILETNESLWREYFRQPANEEACKDSCNIE